MAFWIITALLVTTLALLITEKLPIDLTAIGLMAVLAVTGILPPSEVVAGFANPAVVTVGAMFIISQGMIRTGAVGFIGEKVIRLSRGKPAVAMMIILLVVAVFSAFINNTPVVVLFIPVVMRMCCEFGLSPSKFLIPVSYASILAGTCTLIGTSTNIIVSDLSVSFGFSPIGMFDLVPVGVPIAVLGILVIFFLAPKIMPGHLNPTCEAEGGEHRRFLAEIQIPKGSPLAGLSPAEAFYASHPDMEVLELIRYSHIYYPDSDDVRIAPDDLLLVRGSANDLVEILQSGNAGLPLSEIGLDFGASGKDLFVTELILPPQSRLIGRKLEETDIVTGRGLHLIAIKRSGLHYTEKQIRNIRLKMGDILLFWCTGDKLSEMRGRADYIIVEDIHHEIVHHRKAGRAGAIFTAMIIAASTGIADIMVCALAAVFLMLLSGCLQMRDAYRALQGNVLMLIAGTIALGAAMEQTGVSRIYADAFLGLFRELSPGWILAGFLALTSLGTQLLSNNATAVLILPVAVSTAKGLGVNPYPFIVAVCFGASACFATPIGYQTNLLVYGPGGYRFSDYLKLGLPLNLMVIGMGALMIPQVWPF